MKKTAVVLLILLVTLSVTGCSKKESAAGGSASGDQRTDITLWLGNWWEEKAPGMIADFNAANPKWNLKIDLLPIAGYFDNAAVAILSGSPPDVFDLVSTNLPSFANRNLLTDLTDSVGSKLNGDDFIKAIWDASHYNGRLYGMPSRGSGIAYYYNKDLFDKAGVPYPKENWTHLDMLDAAKKITIPGVQYGIGIAADPSDISNVFNSFSPFLWSLKGDFLSADEKKCLMDTPESIAGITFWTEFYTKWHVAPEGSVNFTTARDLVPLFDQGKVALIPYGISGIDIFSKNADLRWGVAQSPNGELNSGGWMLVVPTTAAHPDGGADFCLWYAKPENQYKHASVEPSVKAAWDMGPPWNDPNRKAYMTAASIGRPGIMTPAWPDALKIIVTELQNVLTGRKTPTQAGQDMVRQIDPLL